MLKFTKKCLFTAMTFFSFNGIAFNPLSTNSLECVSMNNLNNNVNTNKPVFYPYSITINKCKGSCNIINHPYVILCVPDIIKNINVKVFNLMSRTNEKRHIE